MSQKNIDSFFARKSAANTPSTSSANIENESVPSVSVESNEPSSSKTVETAASDNLDVVESVSDAESDDKSVYQQAAKRKKQTVRKYDQDYLAFGFIEKVVSEIPRPFICCAMFYLRIAPWFRVNWNGVLQKTTPMSQKKPIEYFKELKFQHKSQGIAMTSFTQTE